MARSRSVPYHALKLVRPAFGKSRTATRESRHRSRRPPLHRALIATGRLALVGFLLFALLRVPARTGFELTTPACRIATAGTSFADPFMNVPHLVLFFVFFLLVYVALGPVWRRMAWSLVMTLGFGVILEIQQSATRTGNCELVDLLPDAVGALAGALVVVTFLAAKRRLSAP